MIVNANGCPALLAATLLVLCVSPVRAETVTATPVVTDGANAAIATVGKRSGPASHHRSHHKPQAIAAQADADRSDGQPAMRAAAAEGGTPPAISPSVANANAKMLLAGVQLSAISAVPAGNDALAAAADSPAAEKTDDTTLVAAADQLSDVDRGLREGAQAAEPAPSPQTVQIAAISITPEGSVWNQTSLIGKIFIGFGALLTMASAARMFMA